MVKIRNKCIVCGSELSGPLFAAGNMPCGAQAMPDEYELEADEGVYLELCRCPECGLVQFDCEPVDYYKSAIRVVGLSETMKQLRREDYQRLIEGYGKGGKKWLECGCSNGDFLEVLKEFDVDMYGIEAGNQGLFEAEKKLGEDAMLMLMFTEEADMRIPGAPFDVFLSFNFLEHQPDPVTMLRCLRSNLADDGIGLITVPSFEYIIGKGRYYELIRDHIANYDMHSLTNLCRICGFEVLEKDFIGIGDTLRVIVRKGEFKAPQPVPEDGDYDVSRLAGDYKEMSAKIAAFTEELKEEGRSLALWGAGHQGFTLAATTELKDSVRYIIDSSDKKQGKYAPASHIPIVSPDSFFEDPVDVIMIAAPGYIREIEASIRKLYTKENGCKAVPAVCDVLDIRER